MTRDEQARTRRNLNPTPEARVAMIIWGKEYSEQRGGSMDFWNRLDDDRKRRCAFVVEALTRTESPNATYSRAMREAAEIVDEWLENAMYDRTREEGEVLLAILRAKAIEACDHEWTDMRNEIIESGEICLKCNSIRAAEDTPAPEEPGA